MNTSASGTEPSPVRSKLSPRHAYFAKTERPCAGTGAAPIPPSFSRIDADLPPAEIKKKFPRFKVRCCAREGVGGQSCLLPSVEAHACQVGHSAERPCPS